MSDLTHSDLLVTRGDFDHFGLPAFVSSFFDLALGGVLWLELIWRLVVYPLLVTIIYAKKWRR